MERFNVKNEYKSPSDANKKGIRFSSRNTVCREAFAGKIEDINALQVKFDCGEGNRGGRLL